MGCWDQLFNIWAYKQRAHGSGLRSPAAGVQADSWLTSESSWRRSPPSQSGCDDGLMPRLKRQHPGRTHPDSVLDTLWCPSRQTVSLGLCSVQTSLLHLFFSSWGKFWPSDVTVQLSRLRQGWACSYFLPSRFLLCIYLSWAPWHLQLFPVSLHCGLWRWCSVQFTFTIT